MRWITNSPVLCEVCGNARLSGFCCESHPPIAVLIPDVMPNDTETEELSGRAEKGREGMRESDKKVAKTYSWSSERQNIIYTLTD